MEYLKQQVGSTINHKLVEFLQKREIIEKLIKLAVSNPTNPNNVDESFRFPNVAQELLSNSFLLVQAIIDGGWVMKTVVTELSDDEDFDVDET